MSEIIREFGHYIVAAAIRGEDGQVWALPAPARHSDVMRFACAKGASPDWPPETQGFLTSTGKFVNRFQARVIALRFGQITATKWGKELYSEDLW